MVRRGTRSILMVILGLGMAILQIESAQAKLAGKEKILMERGMVKELAASLTKGVKGRAGKVSRLYSFVRDEIETFEFKRRRSPSRVLKDGAGREEDKAKLLSKLLKGIKEEGYLATINLVKYGEDMIYSFVVLKVTKKEEAQAMSKATGGGGKFTWFSLEGTKGAFIPLVPLSGYSIGQLSTEFYKEVEKGSGKWKKWKYNVNFVSF